ncbi:unnamed protein product [Lota lota]
MHITPCLALLIVSFLQCAYGYQPLLSSDLETEVSVLSYSSVSVPIEQGPAGAPQKLARIYWLGQKEGALQSSEILSIPAITPQSKKHTPPSPALFLKRAFLRCGAPCVN